MPPNSSTPMDSEERFVPINDRVTRDEYIAHAGDVIHYCAETGHAVAIVDPDGSTWGLVSVPGPDPMLATAAHLADVADELLDAWRLLDWPEVARLRTKLCNAVTAYREENP